MGLFGCCRRRGGDRAAKATAAELAPCEEEPGEYLLVKDALVRQDVSLDSAKVAELKVGSSVTIEEVVAEKAKRKVRGRIREPAGWITLRDQASGVVMAVSGMRSPTATSLKAGHALLAMSKLTLRLDEDLESAYLTQLSEDEALEVLQVGVGRRVQVKSANGQVGWVSLKTDDGVPLVKQWMPTDAPADANASKGGDVAGRWLRGVAVPGHLAIGFCDALRSEFVDSTDLATKHWLEKPEVPEHVREVLRPELRAVAAGTSPSRRAESVAAVASRLGVSAETGADVEPVSVVLAATDEAPKAVDVEQAKPAAAVVLQREPTPDLPPAVIAEAASPERIEPIKPLLGLGGDGKFVPPSISCLEEVLPPTLDDDMPPKPREVTNGRQPWCNGILCCH